MGIKIQEHVQRVLKRVRQYSVSQHEGCSVTLLLGASVHQAVSEEGFEPNPPADCVLHA